MLASRKSRLLLILLSFIVLFICGVMVADAAGPQSFVPLRLVTHFSWGGLAHEAQTMNECVECHEWEDFHTCETCHDDHGAVEMAGVPFNDLLLLTGDVPKPAYIPVNEILPYREYTSTHVVFLDFLAQYGVTDFESVTMASLDGGFTTVERQYLAREALLMPHIEGVRFADENLHVSTWLKGITRIVVVGREKPLLVDGQATSIGRLLVGPTRSVTVEQADVMLKSETDGQVRRGTTASRIEGAAVENLVTTPAFATLLVRDGLGRERALTADEVQGAVLALVQGKVTLVLPQRGRSQWVTDVVEIVSE